MNQSQLILVREANFHRVARDPASRSDRVIRGLSSSVAVAAAILGGSFGAVAVHAAPPAFTVSSPDLVSGKFDKKFTLNAFGCTGSNVSPAIRWSNVPSGTKSLALQVQDKDAAAGTGFWHWTVYNIPATATELQQGAGNAPGTLPAPAIGGANDFQDTGATGGNGNYGGPCPAAGDKPHHYIFTLYALAVDDVEAASGIPKTGTPDLHSFILNKGFGDKMLGKATFTASYGR
jgi:Raf kinase inhibitor-like YbhB/YbcL family protein